MNVRDVADLPELMQLQARCHLDQADLLQQQIKGLEKALHPHLVPDADVQRLLRIPGIGKVCAFTLTLEIDDIDRFASDREFFSYCRLVPGADNSGERVRHKRSREGNRYLKLAFSHAAVRAIQYYPEIRDWYRRKKRKKPDPVARALVAKETRAHRLPRPPQTGRLQWPVQRGDPEPRQARAVAPTSKPGQYN